MNAFHFSAYECAIALVEIRDLQHSTVLKFARCVSEKRVSQVAPAFEIEIHRQKRDIVCDVDKAKAVVELDAVEDGNRFRREMDVVEM